MRQKWLTGIVAGVLALGCGDEGGGGEEKEPITFPYTVTMGAEQALVATTGEVILATDFINGDVVTYKNQTIKIASGCPSDPQHCQPLHVCRVSAASKPEKYEDLSTVCMNPPTDEEAGMSIPNAESGMGFTVKLNSVENGYGRFFIKEVVGSGDAAKVTFVYSLWGM